MRDREDLEEKSTGRLEETDQLERLPNAGIGQGSTQDVAAKTTSPASAQAGWTTGDTAKQPVDEGSSTG